MEDGPKCVQGLWQDPGQAALGQIERLKARLEQHCTVTVISASKKKEEYAREPSRAAFAGKMLYKPAGWNARFFNQLQQFPTKGQHDDAVDALSGAWLWLSENGAVGGQYISANRPMIQAPTAREMQMFAPNRVVEDRMKVRGATNRFGHRVL